jgi:uncharacterized RDD family membrane protein YckC
VQKITEIKETYTVKRKETINGTDTFVEKVFSRSREVPVVEGLPRFGHFLLDRVFFYIFSLLIGVFIGVIIGVTGADIDFETSQMKIYDTLFSWLILQPLFYFIFEASMQSSPAKAILGRIVVDEYGNKPSIKQIFIRSISRSVPFEAFSCLSSRGWHDTWSNTFVLRKKDLNELKLLQKINNIGNSPTGTNE